MFDKSFEIHGIYRDKMFTKKGDLMYDSGWKNNTIVNECREMITSFMKGGPEEIDTQITGETIHGIRYLKVGYGKPEWDALWNGTDVPKADADVSDLIRAYNDLIEIKSDCIEYVEGNRMCLQVKCILESGVPVNTFTESNVVELREFGLFGKYYDREYMINCVYHPLISKDENSRLERVIRLFFGGKPKS